MAKGGNAAQPAAPGKFAFADVVVDAGAHRLLRGGREIAIEPKAFAVLLEFLAHPGRLLSRDQLLDAVWGHAYVTPATLNRLIAQLRRALADHAGKPQCIQTVHGLGYRFIASLQYTAEEVSSSLRFAPPARARIPERTTPLIGRDHDIEALRRLLRENRLVTVTGPGGIGKTQAALETARTIGIDFTDGIWLFDCTAQTDERGLARLLSGTFEIRVAADAEDLVARLRELLHARRALLVFDNCERVTAALGPVLTSLLAACAELRALVTSQRRLNCPGESLYPLPALELPPQGEWISDEQLTILARVPAVQLLLTRSRTFASGFALTAANAGDVAKLCHCLAGLPLALELAAARLRLLSPEQLLARMDDRLLTLAEENPSRPARHQTLRALIEWSFALLSGREQMLLCGLSIFIGACTLGGATAMGAALGLDESQTLDLLGGLMDKSLLTMDGATNPPSYRLLDSVRLFAQERLAAGGGETCARMAHMAYFTQFTERAHKELLGAQQRVWLDRIKREWGNLHAAFEFALTRQDLADGAVALVGNLCWYFRVNTDYGHSAQFLEMALGAGRGSMRHRAWALVALGIVLHHCQAHDQSAPRLREGIALALQLGDRWLAGAGQAVLAFELATCGDFSAAEDCVQGALGVARAQGDSWLRSMALLSRGAALALNDRH
ncbi:MAG TPA: winged helix-turn-helix domain-containing protein, partial [Rhodanobacteraceae bacterium]|nr:winged helix-turn-helix domain-containing protein [Rhodanobacteraceae bacterium]